MSGHFADRLLEAIDRKGSPVCVGLDPRLDLLPSEFQGRSGDEQQAEAIALWGRALLEIVAPIAAAVKPQSAYFEALGPAGVKVYFDLVKFAKASGLVVIGDVKRNDIGSTARAYAAGHLAAADAPDAITVNGYFGADGLAPFVQAARERGKGIFVLVRTSNPSAAAVQDFTGAGGKKFYEHLAEQVAAVGADDGLIGDSGYSCVGAVVARQIFLVPGYGAQGATAADCAAAFKPDGTGAIVNASRSVIYAYREGNYAGADWKKAVAQAAQGFAADIKNAMKT